VPGAVTAAGGEPAGLRSEPVPLAGPGQGGIRTRPPRHLRLPRQARGAADVLRIDVLRGALHAAVLRLGRGGSGAGLAPGPVSAAAVLAPRLNGECSGRAGVASGAVLHPRVA
jgi:hypothetical protein